LESAVKPYGIPGEEIFLRAQTIHLLNQQDWSNYVQVAEQYLAKYGKNISAQEREMFEKALKEQL
jgi:hypothetical protein